MGILPDRSGYLLAAWVVYEEIMAIKKYKKSDK